MIFGRPESDYDAILGKWISGSDDTTHAVGINLRFDSRVSDARKDSFDGFVERPRSADTVIDGLKRYKRERIQLQLSPDFVVDERNRENIIAGGSARTVLNRMFSLFKY